mmetsp:Transcript_17390/g.23441  ORF Transcript_17390/g.23441 Transcript_17390/m.23441 type:complete len:172 (-) Transcript_17390:121-636(-)
MVAIILAIIPQCMVFCCRSFARKVPTNYILLSVFTLLETFAFMFIVSNYETASVMSAAGMTVGMTLAITIYAWRTKTDFTAMGGFFLCLFIGMLMLSFCSLFFSFASWWHPVVAAITVVCYGLYLIFDTQMIAGGRSHQLSMDDYVIGAMLLYTDIMMIFLELLKAFGDKK